MVVYIYYATAAVNFISLQLGSSCQSNRYAMVGKSVYFRALIFCDENKGVFVIGTFYFNGALISETLFSMQKVIDF